MGEGGNFQRTLAILLFSLVCWWAKGNPYFCAKNNFKINRINLSLHIHCTVQMSFLKMKDGEERNLEAILAPFVKLTRRQLWSGHQWFGAT